MTKKIDGLNCPFIVLPNVSKKYSIKKPQQMRGFSITKSLIERF